MGQESPQQQEERINMEKIAVFKFKNDITYAGVEDGIPEIHFGREGHVTRGEIVPNKTASYQGLILVDTGRGLCSLPANAVERVK